MELITSRLTLREFQECDIALFRELEAHPAILSMKNFIRRLDRFSRFLMPYLRNRRNLRMNRSHIENC
jgi:RimJ/RimL family protein N-acetyltransferase